MTFDFDSSEHKAYEKTPAAKAIVSPAGIWVAFDNQALAGWVQGKELEGGKEHNVLTNKLDEDDQPISIAGVIYRQPRILVIGRSPLLYGGADRKVIGIWRRDDGLEKSSYKFARRYMIIFLDANNQTLHSAPIQLTAWGAFQVSFDQQLNAFREACENVYAKANRKPHEAKTTLWHSMWIFCPILKTEKREKAGQASNACICQGFDAPMIEKWESWCIGRQEIAQEIASIHQSTIDWWKKGIVEPSAIQNQDPLRAEVQGRNNLMLESERIMKLLGLSAEDGKRILLKNYGKKSRVQLTDAEFIDFVGYLQNQPIPSESEPEWEEDYMSEIPY